MKCTIITRTQKMTLKTTCCSLLFLTSIIQGLQDVPVFHYKTKEVMVGQNASLPCYIQNIDKNILVISEWSKKDNSSSKLALFTPQHDSPHYFVPNVTLKAINNSNNTALGTKLELLNVEKGNAGTYICVITTFPNGSLRKETELKVKDKIECNMSGNIEVSPGQNVTIHCYEFADVEYTWTKDNMLVSHSASLQLLSVTEANAGLYTLTANTGNRRLEATFTIKVLTQTTVYSSDVSTLSPSSHSSSGVSGAISHSSTTDFPMTDTTPFPTSQSQSMKWQSTSADNTTYNSLAYTQTQASGGYNYSEKLQTTLSYTPSERFETVRPESQHTTQSESVNTDVTSYNHLEATMPFEHDINTEYFRINDTGSVLNKTQIPTDTDSFLKEFTFTTSALSNGTVTVNAGDTLSSLPRSTTGVTVQKDPTQSESQSHLVMTLSIIGGLLLIIVALVLYRRRVIRKRMDLPPPFKPPPPPIKYTAVRNPQQQFPTDRCNSVSIGMSVEMKHTFV